MSKYLTVSRDLAHALCASAFDTDATQTGGIQYTRGRNFGEGAIGRFEEKS
jgi:hypothetical protein